MVEKNFIPEEAKIFRIVTIHGEQHGAPEERALVYKLEDGSRVQGESIPLREGIRMVNGKRRLVIIDCSQPINIGV
ncbi:MAG: hypothetical protein U9Q63_04095 [Patescibacteria group bacterium]|nr:hypothetical protein [Patescibacteria group bacterium]